MPCHSCHKFFTEAKNVHLVNHLFAMADLHRSGRYDRMSDDVFTLRGRAAERAGVRQEECGDIHRGERPPGLPSRRPSQFK